MEGEGKEEREKERKSEFNQVQGLSDWLSLMLDSLGQNESQCDRCSNRKSVLGEHTEAGENSWGSVMQEFHLIWVLATGRI